MFEIKGFRKSLFGYSKNDVCEYLSKINEDFSKRLLEKDRHANEEIDKLRKKIEQLELDKKELLDKQMITANAIFNAEKYSNYIKETANREADKIHNESMLRFEKDTEKLNEYKQTIDNLKSSVILLLEKTSAGADVLIRASENINTHN